MRSDRPSQKAIELFQREATRLDELGQHPQIPQLLAHFAEGDYHYLVQTYIDGLTLEQELARIGVFNETQIRELLSDLLPVLQFIHDQRVIHRDIKPANIIRQRKDGRLMLVDFGASKFTTNSNLTRTGTVIGSAGFSAPEQTAGKATFASDLYSLGVTCIYLLTNVQPYDLYSFVDGKWIWRDYLQYPVSEPLGNILDKMLESAINRRYASAAHILQDLNPDLSKSPPIPFIPLHSNQPVWRCVQTLIGHSNSVAAIACHPNGRSFASTGFDKAIKLWHTGTGALISNFSGHTEPILALAFSPDGESLVSGSVDDTIKVWDLRTETLSKTLPAQIDAILSLSIAISPDGLAIACGSDDHTIKIWQLSTGRLFRKLVQSRAVTTIAISPNGQTLVSGSSDNSIYFWNFGTGELLHIVEAHRRDVNAVAISADNTLMVSASSDGTIKLWDLQTTKLLRSLTGHLDWVRAVALSQDGQLIASGGGDHTVRLWQVATGKLLCTLMGHLKDVNAIAFTPDSKTVISGSSDRTIKLWRKC
jgi:WD40 repeat protein